MNVKDIIGYDEQDELEGGLYWDFVSMTEEKMKSELVGSGLVYFLNDILAQVKNLELKTKMKEQFKKLIFMEKETSCLKKINFSQEEIKILVDSMLEDVIKTKKGKTDLAYWLNNAEIEDSEWLLERYERIYNSQGKAIKLEDIMIENAKLLLSIPNSRVVDILTERHKDKLPKEYLLYYKVKHDSQYIKKRAERYRKLGLITRIGVDSKIPFGAEIEANNKLDIIWKIDNQKGIGNYTVKSEPTVPNGEEIASPVFHDNEEDIAIFKAVLDTMNEMGFYYDEVFENCSGQINIGIDYFNSPQAILIFYELFCNAEEVLFHIANKEGQLIRQSVYNNSRFKPVSGRIGERLVDEDMTLQYVLNLLTPKTYVKSDEKEHIESLLYKKDSICLRDKNRFEIRIFNGSAEFKIWLENMMLIGKMAEIANRCAEVLLLRDEAKPMDEQMLNLREELRDKNLSLEEKLYVFMDLIFRDNQSDKKRYRQVKKTAAGKSRQARPEAVQDRTLLYRFFPILTQ